MFNKTHSLSQLMVNSMLSVAQVKTLELTLNLFSQNMGSVPQESCQLHSNIVQTPATSHYFCSSISCPNNFNRLPPSVPDLQNNQGTELGGDGGSASDPHVCSGPSCPDLIVSGQSYQEKQFIHHVQMRFFLYLYKISLSPKFFKSSILIQGL